VGRVRAAFEVYGSTRDPYNDPLSMAQAQWTVAAGLTSTDHAHSQATQPGLCRWPNGRPAQSISINIIDIYDIHADCYHILYINIMPRTRPRSRKRAHPSTDSNEPENEQEPTSAEPTTYANSITTTTRNPNSSDNDLESDLEITCQP
jgi:hypothetical protein